MIRLAIAVEGPTEEEFVKRILAGYLRTKSVEPTPIRLRRARSTVQGGGNVTVECLTQEMAYLDRSYDAVTSLVDFYGFKDKGNRTIDELEKALHQKIASRIPGWDKTRVLPYVQQYEFEGLLFSDVSAFARVSDIDIAQESLDELRKTRSQFPTPEDINDNRDTAPSKRIKRVIPRYRKVKYGPLLAEEIGLETIRAECPRFNDWVARMESL